MKQHKKADTPLQPAAVQSSKAKATGQDSGCGYNQTPRSWYPSRKDVLVGYVLEELIQNREERQWEKHLFIKYLAHLKTQYK